MYGMFLKKDLKDKLTLYFLKQLEPVSPFEICWQVQTYAAIHQIHFTDTALILPETSRLVLYPDSITPNQQETSSRKNIIYFSDVIHILEFQGSLEVLLRNGHVYLLSGNTSAWKLIDICPEKNHPDANPLLIWYWIFSGNIQFAWWHLKEYAIRTFYL